MISSAPGIWPGSDCRNAGSSEGLDRSITTVSSVGNVESSSSPVVPLTAR